MINFRVKGLAHICEVQIVHRKMYVCRRNDGLGGHDTYVMERCAHEILDFLGEHKALQQIQRQQRSMSTFVAELNAAMAEFSTAVAAAEEKGFEQGVRGTMAAATIARAWRRGDKRHRGPLALTTLLGPSSNPVSFLSRFSGYSSARPLEC